ncbi:tetratricopeptide tpr-2 repeat protein [Leptolyngbya sp. BL0902]|uniref:tetratricopeptide repeat protein n=1 Tax=Leptolyngbya sp. BL0902 TaxID=1115757 RepID=UPI0018E71E56|nr:tetratricopeptide repeat protein [Leptolyngbya sp. BL0902]QQE66502.1 tetratricopeptide tpr-2 repeat protein [Leptolyngbya sp. BL0902]
MAKRKKSLAKIAPGGFGRINLAQELQRVEGLMRRNQWPEAKQRLSDLGGQFPQSKQVWQYLAYASMETDDLVNHQRAMERLTTLDPTNADYFFSLGAACMGNVHPLLALQSFRQGLALNPNHDIAAEAQRVIQDLEPLLAETLTDMGLTEADGLEVALLHERSQACLERGDYGDAREATLGVIDRHPDFLPAQNNLSLVFWAEGDAESAITQARSVLNRQPDNVHALGNLVRFYALTQRPDEARPYADRLLASHAEAWDSWTKKAEALSLLADDAALITMFEDFLAQGGDALDHAPDRAKGASANDPNKAEEVGDALTSPPRPSLMFYHWVAVALARTKKVQRAKTLWQAVLALDPHLEIAKANLADLRRPVGQRHGAWPFSWEQWLLPPTLHTFRQTLDRTMDGKGKRLVAGLEQFLDDHPDFVAMLPRIAERGGPTGQEFLVMTAQQIKHPGLLAAVKDLALGKNGPDALRHQAAILAAQAKLIDKNNVTLWLNGSWETITLMDFDIHSDVLYHHSKQVEKWLKQALGLLRKQTVAAATQAEELLKKAIAAEPDSPDLLNNLAAAYHFQGRTQEVDALIHQICERFPDYLLAAMSQVKLYMKDGNLEDAEAILKRFMERGSFHVDEFSAFCETYVDLMLAKKNPDGARTWLQMWEQTVPDHPRLNIGWAKFDAYTGKHLLEM